MKGKAKVISIIVGVAVFIVGMTLICWIGNLITSNNYYKSREERSDVELIIDYANESTNRDSIPITLCIDNEDVTFTNNNDDNLYCGMQYSIKMGLTNEQHRIKAKLGGSDSNIAQVKIDVKEDSTFLIHFALTDYGLDGSVTQEAE